MKLFVHIEESAPMGKNNQWNALEPSTVPVPGAKVPKPEPRLGVSFELGFKKPPDAPPPEARLPLFEDRLPATLLTLM